MEFQDVAASPALAKMYEEQGNYAMALIMYKKLNEKKHDEFYDKKISYLEEIISSKSKKDRAAIGSFVMSDNEKDVFNIPKEEEKEVEEPEPKPEKKPKKTEQKEELDDILKGSTSDISYLILDKYADMTVEQFLAQLAILIGKNRKLDDVNLMDILQAIERL
ncbi:MAG: hypothetical protein JW794_03935 [Candidatus Cloacimonetes bacterium]|nr:hypothetical protein [Candidatus Cloacimonadota bacterium]